MESLLATSGRNAGKSQNSQEVHPLGELNTASSASTNGVTIADHQINECESWGLMPVGAGVAMAKAAFRRRGWHRVLKGKEQTNVDGAS